MGRRRNANPTGRNKGSGRFFALFYELATSPAFRSLSGPAVKYYVELASRFDGQNNGALHLSGDEAKRLLHMGKTTAYRAQDELEDKGFIRRTIDGDWYRREARTWALTHAQTTVAAATHDYRKWHQERPREKQTLGPPEGRHRSPDGAS